MSSQAHPPSLSDAFRPQIATGPGFEIWFAVCIDSASRQAIWVRYTLFRPAAGCGLPASGMVWASFYDAHHPELHCAGVERVDLASVAISASELRFPQGRLSSDTLIGSIVTPLGPLAWNLKLQQRHRPVKYAPVQLENLGIAKTKAVIASPFALADGEVRLGDRSFAFARAGSLLTHLWGSRHIEELYWLFVPHFEGDDEGWQVEVVSVRPSAFLPAFTFVVLTRKGQLIVNSVFAALSARLRPAYPKISFVVKAGELRLALDCHLDAEQITRYAYTDPDGARRYICHSDTGGVSCRIATRQGERLLIAQTAAVEFHGMRPWDPGFYLDPLKHIDP